MLGITLLFSACTGSTNGTLQLGEITPSATLMAPSPSLSVTLTPLPTRPEYNPGQLVDYVAQSGDTLAGLAARFNTSIQEIREANPEIPLDATTMPPGMPMQIPIYYLPLWGTTYKILPDSLYVNGPSAVGFDTAAFVAAKAGWLKDFTQYAGGANRNGAQIVDYVALNFSLNPRLLLALLEYELGVLSRPDPPDTHYPLGNTDYYYRDFYMQVVWAATQLNNGYYGWRTGRLIEFDLLDGRIERPDPWQSSATVALQYYFSRLHANAAYAVAVGPEGFARTYQNLFGDPWKADRPHIPAYLQQPLLLMPFPAGKTWAYTSGPHSGWGPEDDNPLSAVDFAPQGISGCLPSDQPVVAMADGLVVRSETGIVELDLDRDGDDRTGWVIFYLHVADESRAEQGVVLGAGDVLGFPSCLGGQATGTHIHIARRYNGEWIPADGPLAFNLDGWIVHNGENARAGTLTRENQVIIANQNAVASSLVTAGR
jgi:LasA protease